MLIVVAKELVRGSGRVEMWFRACDAMHSELRIS